MLLEPTRAALAEGIPPHVVVVALRNLIGQPSDLDGGHFATSVAARLDRASPLERRVLAELGLLAGGATIHHLVELCRAALGEVEQAALALLKDDLVDWTLVGLRLRKPVASALLHVGRLGPEFSAAVEERIRRHAAQDAILPTLIGEQSWFELAEAIERIALPSTLRWRALRLLFDTNGTEAHIERLRHLAAIASVDPAFELLRACLQRNAGQLDVALEVTTRLMGHPELGQEARLEHGRTLFLVGRLRESKAVLEATAPLMEPLAASDALRCLALIAQLADRPTEARELSRRALQTARMAQLRVAEARCSLQFAALETADLKLELALEHALRAKLTFDQLVELRDLDLARMGLATVLIHLQRHDEAEVELNLAEKRLENQRFRYLRATAFALLGLSKLDRGEASSARAPLELAIAMVDEGQPRTHALVTGIYALLLIFEGRHLEALERLRGL